VNILRESKDAILFKGFPNFINYMGYDFLFRRSVFHCEISDHLETILRKIPSWKQKSNDQIVVIECLNAINELPKVHSYRQTLGKDTTSRPKRPLKITPKPLEPFQHNLDNHIIETLFDSDTDNSLSEIEFFSSS